MDAFSRLLVSIGQSLGKGLGQVSQTELEQRQRLEVLEAQRKANISSQLLQTFTQLLQTQGIQEVEPSGIDDIKKAVTDLALGKIDSPAVQKAISVFPTVAQAANKIAVYRELATKDIDALSRLIANTDPKEAQTLLKAIGLQGMYEGLRSRGEILTEADRLGLQLTREQIENLAAQRKALLAKLEPEIRLLDAQLRLVGAQADEIIAKLPLVLTRLQLEAQNLAVQIRKGEIEVSKLDQILDAQIKKDLAQVGVSEAQAAVLREQINLIREQVKSEVLRQAQIEAETERTRAQTELTKAETELARARARQITETLEPTIQNLLADVALKEAQRASIEADITLKEAQRAGIEADIALKEAQIAEIQARTKAILDRLPLELENLLLDIKRKGIELERLPDILDAELKERFAKIGLTEAQTGLTEANIDLIREQTKSEILRQLKTEAETELVKRQAALAEKQAELVAEQVKSAAQERRIKLAESATNWLKEITKIAIELSADTPEKAKELLQGFGNFYGLPDDFIDFTAKQVATAVKEARVDKDLQRTGALANVIATVMNTAMAAESPEAARRVVDALLPPSVSKELRASIGNMAYYLKTLRLGSDIATIIEPYMKMLPPSPEDESRVLRELYDNFIRAKGDTPESRRIANGIVNTIKGQWALTRALQSLEQEGKKADIDKDKALTALYKVQAALAPKQFGLEEQKLAFEREEFSFEKWYKAEQVKLGWARLELDKLIAQAQAAGTGEDTIKALKDLASVAKTADSLATGALAKRLRELGKDTCARKLESTGSITILEAVRADDTECNRVIREVLTDKSDPRNREVAEQAERAVQLGRYVTDLTLSFITGGGTPGGAAPITPGAGGRPSGTAAPGSTPSGTTGGALGSDFASGAKAAYNMLKGFGVQIPNDFKEAGAMVFTFGTEQGKRYNPFEIKESSGVTMQEITIEEGGQKKKVKVPVGPDKGFREAIKADKGGKGARQKALDIDSAIAFGIAWIFPNEADKPSMLAKYIREDFRRSNPGLFRRAEYFKSKEGYVDIASVAAAYASMSLERLGVRVQYTKLFTTLLRVLAENDLDMLRMPRPLPSEKAKERYLNMVKSRLGSDRELLEDARKRFGLPPNAPRERVLEEILKSAASLYDATRLSNIGRLVLGGGR